METICETTSIRIINGWLEIKRSSSTSEKYIHVRKEHIAYLSRDGPFHNDAMEIWQVNIILERCNSDRWVKHSITLPFESQEEAENFLMTVNEKLC